MGHQLKSLAQGRQNQIQQLQRELQQAKESLQQNVANQKELQQTHQSHNQEVGSLKSALSQAESKVGTCRFTLQEGETLQIFISLSFLKQVTELQDNVDGLRTVKLPRLSPLASSPPSSSAHSPNHSSPRQTVADRDAEIQSLQQQLSEAAKAKEALQASQSRGDQDQSTDLAAAGDSSQAVQEELGKLRQEVSQLSSARRLWGVLIGKDRVKPKHSRSLGS